MREMRTWFLPLGACALLAVAGCGGDDATTPDTTIVPPNLDGVVPALESALAGGSAESLGILLDDDFTYELDEDDAAALSPPVATLDRAEFLTAMANIAKGTPVTNVRGDTAAAVHAFTMVALTGFGEWTEVPGAARPGTMTKAVSVAMGLVRLPDAPNVPMAAVWDVTAVPAGGVAQPDRYVIVGLRERPGVPTAAGPEFGSVLCTYMTDPPPTAVLEVTYNEGFPYGTYGGVLASALGSSDDGRDPAELQYSLSIDAEGPWSASTAETVANWQLPGPGAYVVHLQVTDRWGQVDEAEQSVTAVAMYPIATTPEQLMANFVTINESMDYDSYLAIVDPSFLIYLNQATVTEFSLPREFFDYYEDSSITRHMFSGDAITRPDGTVVPGIVSIEFVSFYAEAAWTTSPPDDRIPDALWAPYRVDIVVNQGSRELRIQGRLDCYVKAFDGEAETVYRMVGVVDNTAPPADKPTDDAAWGDVKALYR